MYKLPSRFILMISILVVAFSNVYSQTGMPEVLTKNSINEQLKFLEEKTKIYENYRAIREDMFQKLKTNISDTLSISSNKIAQLNFNNSSLKRTIDTLNTSVAGLKTRLDEMTRTKNSVKVLGIEVNKSSYNTVMWTIIAALLIILGIGFLIFKRNLMVTINTNKELKDLKDEFEAYRKTTREAREKLSMAHFNELKKLKGE